MANAKLPALKLNGKPIGLCPESPAVRRVREFLDRLPADELLDRQELSARVHVATDYLHTGIQQRLPGYHAVLNRKQVWGNPRAIQSLQQLMEAA